MTNKARQYFFFSLNVPYHQCQAMYEGGLPNAILTAENGKRVQIPIGHLKQCINSSGLKGRFRLSVDENHKFLEFVRVTT